MGFKISSLFFVDEEGAVESKDAVKSVEVAKEATVSSNVKQDTVQQSQPVSSVSVDKDIATKAKEALLKALNDSNFEGYDYLEFKESLKALEAIISDESTRYKSAFAAVAGIGVTNQKLVDTAQKYIEVLKNEEKKFLFALGTKSDNDVTGAERRIVQIGEEIKKKDEEIARIIAEKQKIEQEKINLVKSISESKSKIENSKNGFYSALNEVIGNISNDINKINSYIGPIKQ